MLVLPGCLPIPGFAQTTLTTPLDEQQIRAPLPKEATTGTPSADRRVPLQSPDSNSLESAPGKDKDRLPGLPETLAVPEPAEPVTEFQEFVASSLGRKLPIYGHSLFNHVPTTFAPVDRIPVTDDYLIGPGDEILIRAWGQIDLDGKLVVDREGEVFLPKVGALSVAGLKYQQLPEFFRNAIGRVFRNFDLTVSLGQLRSIQVFVVGQARHPGNYTVSSLSTLVNALFASGGPSATGSMRHIQLKRNNLVVTEFDFYDLLLKGDKSKDARLLPGDVIYIPPSGPSIAMAGSVNAPAIYELRNGTTLAGAVEMAGGLATTADGQKAVVERIENHDTRRVEEFPLDQQGWVRPLKDGDVVRIFPLSPRFQNAVTLLGNVAHPGRVEWHRGMRLKDLIPNQEALITRDYWSTTNGGVHSELPRNPRDNWSPAYANAQPEFTRYPDGTRPADMSSTTDFTADVAPATDAARSGSTSPKTDLIRTAPEINWDYAVIQRLNPQNLTPQLVPFNLGKLVLEGDEQNNLALEPGDTVIIFSQNDIAVPTEKRSAFLRLEGEFRTAGVFRAETGETLRHLVERVGGYTNNGNLIGDTVGRMGRAIQFWFTYWISPQNALQFTYKHNTVNQRFVPQGGAWQDYSLRHELYLHSGLYVKSQLQYEHISRYPLLFPGPQRNVTAIVELGFVPHKSK
jgi:protein involved in polysaccharide export with SLBB domain